MDYLDRLIASGWADVDQNRIPAHVMEAAKAGLSIPPRPIRKKAEPKPKIETVASMRANVPHKPFRKTLVTGWRNGVRSRDGARASA